MQFIRDIKQIQKTRNITLKIIFSNQLKHQADEYINLLVKIKHQFNKKKNHYIIRKSIKKTKRWELKKQNHCKPIKRKIKTVATEISSLSLFQRSKKTRHLLLQEKTSYKCNASNISMQGDTTGFDCMFQNKYHNNRNTNSNANSCVHFVHNNQYFFG